MAPGTSGRPTGTVPKNKPKSSGSQSHRAHRESFIQSSSLDWEPISDLRNKKSGHKSSAQSEPEANSIQVDLEGSRSSTMTSQSENREGCSQSSLSNKTNIPDRKQVVNKLSQIQTYLQQTADLMETIKSSDSPAQRNQYNKLSVMLEELKDSETKLRGLLNKMDNTESRIDSLLTNLLEKQLSVENGESRRMQKFTKIVNDNYGPLMCFDNTENNNEVDEEEMLRQSDESKKKLEALQKRKQELLFLQEKAKKQLLEAQAEQSRLVARASSLNQELSANKAIDLNVQQLSQRLKAVQQIYNTRNQINDSLKDNRRANIQETKHPEGNDHCQENSDTETDFQLVADKMEELNVMKAQLGEIQKIMASINGMQNQEPLSRSSETEENTNFGNKSSFSTEGEARSDDPNSNNLMKLEQAKSKLNHLTQLLEIVQTAQTSSGLSPSYLQLVSNLVNEETESSSQSPSLPDSVKTAPKNREDVSVESMKIMAKGLEETTAAMKEERDKLVAARQELQNIARRIPQKSIERASLSPGDSESEPPYLKKNSIDSNSRDILNGSDSLEAEQSPNCNEGSFYSYKAGTTASSRSKQQRGVWSTTSAPPSASNQGRRSKNEPHSRGSTHSSRVGSRCLGRDSRWSPSSSTTYDKSNLAAQAAHNQLEWSGNLCEIMLSESLQQGIYPGEITLQEMFHQHQLLTRTVAQCSQLLWLQQKQIIELRNALMLQTGPFSNLPVQQSVASQTQCNIPTVNNTPYSVFQPISNFPNSNPLSTVPVHQQQNCLSANQNQIKLNCREIQRAPVSQQEQFPENFSQQVSQSSLHFPAPDLLGYEARFGNFNRLNPPISNSNQNINHNIFSNSNNRVPNGLNSLGPEDSGALNNQVPPGNRANNYWDNFRSYSRQNLLSTTKSNEDIESSRRSFLGQERFPRELGLSSQNNQIPTLSPLQPAANTVNPDLFSNDHHHHHQPPPSPPSQNIQANHHAQITRSRSVEPQTHRNTSKNETRNQDNDSRNLNKNEGLIGARARNPECGSENLRSVRNDVNQSLRNDNLNSSRNFDNEDNLHGNSKKRLERSRCRKESTGNLNNKSQCNTSLWQNISSEVSNFIRTNETRPQFLIQLFRDLQQVTNDNLRQRTLDLIQETVNANNLTERSSNTNSNIIENRNNIRENRSNINRNQAGQEDPTRIDELFYHLRENQNTIRQNIGMNAFVFGGNNLENPNISNIRDLVNSRNNLESEGLKDLRTYFEANLCSFGDNHSTLENPNLSNIRENLTRRAPGTSDHENINPKNVYLSIYDNVAIELRRRNQEQAEAEDCSRNFGTDNELGRNEFINETESVRTNTNQFEQENIFEGAVGGRGHYHQENASIGARFPVLDGGDSFLNSRQFLTNANDSGIDINYNNDERKTFAEGEMAVCTANSKIKKIEGIANVEMATVTVSQWERSSGRDNTINSINSPSPSLLHLPMSENSFFECPTLQQSDNGDLAEADQSRNEETLNAESDSGFINSQKVERSSNLSISQNHQNSENNLSSLNIPESERNFTDNQNYSLNGANGEENFCFSDTISEGEVNFHSSYESIQKSESSEVFYYPINATCTSSDLRRTKSGTHYGIKEEAAEREKSDMSKECSKTLTNKFRDNASGKCNGATSSVYDVRSGDSDSANSLAERQFTESRESLYSGTFQYVFDKNEKTEIENMSQEAESDWECESGLDQVPTRLQKNGSKKSSNSTI